MGTLSYDFESDTVGQKADGWTDDGGASPGYSAIAEVSGSNVLDVHAVTGLWYCKNEDCSDVGDGVISGEFNYSIVNTSAIIYFRADGTSGLEDTYMVQYATNHTLLLYKRVEDSGSLITSVGKVLPNLTKIYFRISFVGNALKIYMGTSAFSGSWDIETTDSEFTSGDIYIASYAYGTYFDNISIESDDIPTGVEQDPLGTLTISGHDPTVLATAGVHQDPVGTLEIEGYNPTVLEGGVEPVGTIEVTGYNPTVDAEESAVKLFFKFKDSEGNVWSREIGRRAPVRSVVYDAVVDPLYLLSSTEEIVLADATEGDFDIEMVTAVGREGFVYTVKKVDTTAYTVTLAPALSEEIDGDSTFVLYSQHESVTLVSDGADWWII